MTGGANPALELIPVPESGTVCGLPGELSVTLMLALRDAATEGVKVTEIVQDADPASVAPHVVVFEKSAAFVPVIEILIEDMRVVPVFVIVTTIGELGTVTTVFGNVTLVGENDATVTPPPTASNRIGTAPIVTVLPIVCTPPKISIQSPL